MIVLQCSAVGIPKPDIIWVKKNSGRAVIGGAFILESAVPEDSGNWSCRASNLLGTDVANTEIIVASKRLIENVGLLVPVFSKCNEQLKEKQL